MHIIILNHFRIRIHTIIVQTSCYAIIFYMHFTNLYIHLIYAKSINLKLWLYTGMEVRLHEDLVNNR